MRLCTNCRKEEAMRHSDLCGLCDIDLAKKKGEFHGLMTALPASVPAHFNHGLGEYVEDRYDLERKRQKAKAEGEVAGWD